MRHPEGGFVPTVPDVTTMRTLYEVRVGLELQALHRPARLGQSHDLRRIEALRLEWQGILGEEPIPSPDFVLLDESFHVTLADAAGNAVLVEFLRTVNERIRIVRMHDFLTPDRIVETVAQHLGILDAVLVHDIELAAARFDDHLRESLGVVEKRTLHAIALMAGLEGGTP